MEKTATSLSRIEEFISRLDKKDTHGGVILLDNEMDASGKSAITPVSNNVCTNEKASACMTNEISCSNKFDYCDLMTNKGSCSNFKPVVSFVGCQA